MRRAPYSSEFRATDSVLQGAWATDSDEQLTLGPELETPFQEPAQEPTQFASTPAPAPAGIRLRAGIRLYLDAKTAEGLSPRSIEWYAMVLGRVARDLGPGREIDTISPSELRAWLVTLRETLSPGSVLGYYRASKAFGNWLAREGIAAAAGFLALRRPKTPSRVIEPIPDDDLRRLLAAASVRDRALILLLLDTGLRLSEAAGITLSDLRADGSIKVMGKGSRERIVPVGPTARSALVRYLSERRTGDPNDGLFLGREGALTTRGIHQLLARLKRRTGVRSRCNPHSLRHTFARAYLVNGGDLFSLQRILGHSTLDMVRRYVALADSDVARRHEVASPADRLLGRPRPNNRGAAGLEPETAKTSSGGRLPPSSDQMRLEDEPKRRPVKAYAKPIGTDATGDRKEVRTPAEQHPGAIPPRVSPQGGEVTGLGAKDSWRPFRSPGSSVRWTR
jgi:integrase/recombinase XerC